MKKFNGHDEAKATNCPICGRKRSSHDFSHGKCYIEQAKRESEAKIKRNINGKEFNASEQSVRMAKAKCVSKQYKSGRLPEWMFS